MRDRSGFILAMLFGTLLLLSARASGEVATLISDPSASADGASESSEPYGYTRFNGVVYFTATDNEHGRELWRTDGTDAGTFLVADITPGSVDSSPNNYTVMG
nr:hypothetical protein [Planctomycetota bacterium]